MRKYSNPLSTYFCAVISACLLLFTLFGCSDNSSGSRNDHSTSFNQVIINAGNIYLPYKSLNKVDSAYKAIRNPTIEEQCMWYEFRSSYFFSHGDFSKAMANADSILQIIQKNNLERELARFNGKAHFLKGDILMELKNYNNAFRNFYEARKNIGLVNDTCLYSDYTGRLGTISYRQENYLSAAGYYKKVIQELQHCDELNKFKYTHANMDNVALSYDKYGMTDSALYYFKQSLDYIAAHEHEFPQEKETIEMSRGIVYGNQGTTYFRIGKTAEAEALFKKSIAINIKEGYVNGDALLTRLKLADLYLKTSRPEQARSVLQEAESTLDPLSKNHFTRDLGIRWYKLQSDYYTQVNDPRTSNRYLNTYITLKDSIDQINSKLAGADFDKEFAAIEQQNMLRILKKNDQLKTLYLISAIIIVVLSILVTLLIWQNRKRLKRLNVRIISQNLDMHTTLTALEQSQAENTRMMNIVAHDLRSPMAATISIANMLLENGNLSPEDREMLELMETSSLHSMEMITDLLNMNTSSEGLKKEPVEMHTLLQYCVNLLKFKASEKKQEIALQAPDITLNVNREKIWRVISNLLVNALKFSPEGSKINVYMQQEPDTVLIGIHDYGIGIPDDLKDKVFNMFTDARRAGTSGEQSFGLGLAISKQIVEAHGGKIWFHSDQDDGTTFYVELPQ